MLPTTTFCLTTSETTIDLASSEGANSVAGPSTLDNDGLTEGEKKQMLIETPDYRILSETDALGRLRFKSEDVSTAFVALKRLRILMRSLSYIPRPKDRPNRFIYIPTPPPLSRSSRKTFETTRARASGP